MINEEDKEWVTQALEEFERNNCTSRILKIERENATAEGDNYLSNILRLKLDVILQSGDIQRRSIICKCQPRNEATKELTEKMSVFAKEKRIIQEILPAMDKIVQKYNPGSEPFYARFIGSQGNNKLLLEDLKALGYEIAGSRKGLDFDHCALLLKTLGKYHALGAVLLQEGRIDKDKYMRYFFEIKKTYSDHLFSNNLKALAYIAENKWKGEWAEYGERLRRCADRLPNEMSNLYIRDERNFNVFLHGDCWFNNLMYKYNKDGKPIHVRLLDFQMVWYNSIGFDLNFFLWTSVHISVRPRNAELIRLYHESLLYHLNHNGYAKSPPSLQDVVADYERTIFYGFVAATSFLEFMMQESTDVPDMTQTSRNMLDEVLTACFINIDKEESENYKKALQYVIKEADKLSLI